MAIMKFNEPPEARLPTRKHAIGHGDGVALQHEAFGSKLQGGAQVNTLNENYGLATRWSTAPYRGPDQRPPTNPFGYRDASRQGMCTAKDDTCGARATAASDKKWCIFHTPKADE